MTDVQQYICPVDDCTYCAGSEGSVLGHITRSTDGGHEGLSGPNFRGSLNTVSVDSVDDSDGDSEPDSDENTEQASNSEQSVTFPAAEQTVSENTEPIGCCSNPDLEGEAGEVFELQDGTFVQLEAGDQICSNCDHIHE